MSNTPAAKRLAGILLSLLVVAFIGRYGTARSRARLGVFAQVSQVDTLDLGFEYAIAPALGQAAGWFVSDSGYVVAADTSVRLAGKRSLRVEFAGRSGRALGGATAMLSADPLWNRRLRLHGFIRTADVANGYAGLWIRVDDRGGRMISIDNMSTRQVTGSHDWTEYSVAASVDSSAGAVFFGVFLSGAGVAWFDSLSLELDGHPFPLVSTRWTPTRDDIDWVTSHAVPIGTVDSSASNADLEQIGAIVGDANIVGLGEGTHGTSEFFRMKARMTRWLAEHKGFGLFAMEVNMPEARLLNDYVLHGRGDARTLLAGLHGWTWNTGEVLDLIEWMRRFNASGHGRLEFYGFDAQAALVAMDSVTAFVTAYDPRRRVDVANAYADIRSVVRSYMRGDRRGINERWLPDAVRVEQALEADGATLLAKGLDSLEVAWALQYADLVAQSAAMALSPLARDSLMAVNVQWIRAHSAPNSKAIMWAHNGHVGRIPGRMGGALSDRYGGAMRVFGFALGTGSYNAMGPKGLTAYPAAAPRPGSIEDVLHRTGIPRLALDLRGVRSNPASAWLDSTRDFRSLGAIATDAQFFPTRLAAQLDAVIYIDRTTPSALFGFGTPIRP